MYHNMILKRVFLPVGSSSIIAASVIASSESKEEKEKVLTRPRDLSLYRKPAQEQSQTDSEPKPESAVLSVVRQARESIWAVSDQLTQVSDKFNHIVDTGKAHTLSSIEILREKDNLAHRVGAITVGGLLGFIVSLRRGWFRRIIYAGTGAVAVAAVCYPEEAREYSSEGVKEAKRFIVIAYHFVNGVLRDYGGLQLPSLPGPLTMSGGDSPPTSATLMPPPATTPSHISSAPLPPIDIPPSVSGFQKKQGRNDSSDEQNGNEDSNPEPKPASYVIKDPSLSLAESSEEYSLYSRRH